MIYSRMMGCMGTNLNELIVGHVSTVKRLLVIHKSRQFSLLNLFAAQHQHSWGKDTLLNRFYTWQGSCTDNTHRVCPTKDRTSMSSVSLPASERSGHKPWREFERGCKQCLCLPNRRPKKKTDMSENALVLEAVNSVDPSRGAIDCVSE